MVLRRRFSVSASAAIAVAVLMVGAVSGVILLGLVQNILDLATRRTTGSRPSTGMSSRKTRS